MMTLAWFRFGPMVTPRSRCRRISVISSSVKTFPFPWRWRNVGAMAASEDLACSNDLIISSSKSCSPLLALSTSNWVSLIMCCMCLPSPLKESSINLSMSLWIDGGEVKSMSVNRLKDDEIVEDEADVTIFWLLATIFLTAFLLCTVTVLCILAILTGFCSDGYEFKLPKFLNDFEDILGQSVFPNLYPIGEKMCPRVPKRRR